MSRAIPKPLRRLASAWGLQIGYYDIQRVWREPSQEAILSVLRALGAGLERMEDVPSALKAAQESLWRSPLEPGIPCLEEEPVRIRVRPPKSPRSGSLVFEVHEEEGTLKRIELPYEALSPIRAGQTPYATPLYAITLPLRLSAGYHRLRLKLDDQEFSSHLFCSPKRAFVHESWQELGLFLPLHALHSKKSMGLGDFGDLERFVQFARDLGASLVGMLPLVSSFVEGPLFNPSPYSPVSRQFVNPVFIDIHQIPGLNANKEAMGRLQDPAFLASVQALNQEHLVDYKRVMELKRSILEPLAEVYFHRGDFAGLEAFLREYPKAKEFALFMAAVEALKLGFRQWPERMKSGGLLPGDVPPKAFRYHLFSQWQACCQLKTLCKQTKAKKGAIYLDLPVGVNPDGFDAWAYQGCFIEGLSIGAPPDTFFTLGQNWGFLPPHPRKTREAGHRDFIETIRINLGLAGVLRLDHVMGLHRLFVIPSGFEAKDGMYLRYPYEELYSILAIESHRAKSMLVGEDLGTVPGYIRKAMERRGLQRMYCLLTEIRPDSEQALPDPGENALASLGTHDMPTFASFLEALDIQERIKLGYLSKEKEAEEFESRQRIVHSLKGFLKAKGLFQGEDLEALLFASLKFLSLSQSRIMLINLEDLWLERASQNMPGTGEERPNWRRKAALGLEQIESDPKVLELFKALADLRKKERGL